MSPKTQLMPIRWIAFLILTFLVLAANAYQPIYVLDRATGLSDNRVHCMMQAADGQIWIGTECGLNTFNGNTIRSIYAGGNLISSKILSLCQLADGSIWVGTDGGISRILPNGQSAGATIELPGQIGKEAHELICDESQNVWVRSSAGIANFSPSGNLLQVLSQNNGLLSSRVTCMAIDDNGNMWIGTADAGIEFYSTRQKRFLHYGTQLAGSHGEISTHISGLQFDKNGSLWVTNAEGGLVRLQLIESLAKLYFPRFANITESELLSQDNNGYIWSFHAPSGLYYKAPGADSLNLFLSQEELMSAEISLLHTRSGYIFAASSRKGIAVYSHPLSGMFAPLREIPSGWHILCDGAANYIWLTKGMSVLRMSVSVENGDIAASQRGSLLHLPSQAVSAFSDANSKLWVLSKDSVLRIYRPEGELMNELRMPSAEPLAICNEDGGNLLFTQNNRLYRCNSASVSETKQLNFVPRHILFSGTTYLFICDANSYIWDGKHDVFSEAGFLSALSPIFSASRASSGELYLGTISGIYRLNAHVDIELTAPEQITTGHPCYSLAILGTMLIGVQDSSLIMIRTNADQSRLWLYGIQIPAVTESGLVLIGKKSGVLLLQTRAGIIAKSADALAKPERQPEWQLMIRSASNGTILAVSKDGQLTVNHLSPSLIIDAGDIGMGNYGQPLVLVLPNGDSLVSSNGRFAVMAKMIGTGNQEITLFPQGKPQFKATINISTPRTFSAIWLIMILLIIIVSGLALYNQKQLRRKIRYFILGSRQDAKLRELYQAKLHFFTEISHEIRTPLTMIIDPIDQILKQETLSNFTKDKLRIVLENGDKILNLVDSLLDYRKLETGSDTLLAEETDMSEAVEFTIGRFRELALQRSQDIILHVPQEQLLAWIDRNKFDKIVSSIMENVLMNNAEGCSIGVWVFEEEPRNRFRGTSRIIVQVGELSASNAPDESRPQIEQFFTDTNTSNPHSAPGLGLVLAKKLAELHKGELTAERQQNGYYQFKLSLNKGNEHLEPQEMVQQRLPLQSELYDKGEIMPSDKKCILLVEDNNNVLDYLDNIFLKKYEVLKAGNGREGLELAQAYIPDIIISDIMMPEMDGTEMCKRLKNSHTTAHIPIILLTAKTFTEDQVEGLEAGADDYIHKPFKSEILELKVKNILESAERMRKQLKNDLISMPTEAFIESEEDKLMKKLINYIDRNISDTEISVETLAAEMGVSRAQLFRKTRAVLGQTPNDLLKSMRLKKAEQLLRQGNLRISDIAFEVGFPNPQYFSQSFVKMYGATPSAYLKKLDINRNHADLSDEE